jgi:hypothetical protein
MEPVHVYADDGKGNITGSLAGVIMFNGKMMKKYLSRRLVIYGGPLYSPELSADMIIPGLLKTLHDQISRRIIYTEIRNLFDQSEWIRIYKQAGYSYSENLNYLVSINPETENNIHNNKLRQIKKSLENGAYISEPAGEEEVRTFYTILADLYSKKVRKPLPDISFFLEFYRMPGLGKYLLVKKDGEIFGGIMFPFFSGIIYEWYVASVMSNTGGFYPGVLATWAPLRFAMDNGLRMFDFMGAGKPQKDYGVRQFKSQFGGELVNFGRFTRVHNSILYNTGKLALKIIQKTV